MSMIKTTLNTEKNIYAGAHETVPFKITLNKQPLLIRFYQPGLLKIYIRSASDIKCDNTHIHVNLMDVYIISGHLDTVRWFVSPICEEAWEYQLIATM